MRWPAWRTPWPTRPEWVRERARPARRHRRGARTGPGTANRPPADRVPAAVARSAVADPVLRRTRGDVARGEPVRPERLGGRRLLDDLALRELHRRDRGL